MMRHFYISFQIAFFLLGASACASFSDGPYEITEGQFFDYRSVEQIKEKITTEGQILEWFGPPVVSTDLGEIKTLRYHMTRRRRSIKRELFSKKIYEQTVTHELTLSISDGIVLSYSYLTSDSEA